MPVSLIIPDRTARGRRRRRAAPAADPHPDCQALYMQFSMLMGGIMFCATLGVLEHVAWAEADASVVRYRLQPDRLSWDQDGTIHHHDPHMEVKFDDGRSELHEVQPLEKLSSQERDACMERATLLNGLLAHHGKAYRLVDSTSESFRLTGVAAAEAMNASREALPTGLPDLVQETMRSHGPTTFGALQALVPSATRRNLLGLAPRRQLVIELRDGPAFGLTPIRPVSEKYFPRPS